MGHNRTVDELNQLDKEPFVEVLGSVYEESPWVARRAWTDRPFSSVTDLRTAMRDAVQDASREKQLQLLRNHPDLGETTEMTDASAEEQSSAGLDQLQPEQYRAFQRLNETYREKFDFPFIMAVRDESPERIREAMQARLDNSEPQEFETALEEVHTIARLRLMDLVSS